MHLYCSLKITKLPVETALSDQCHCSTLHKLGLVARKLVFGGLQTTKARTSLRIRADQSAPLLFAFFKLSNLKFDLLASLCS